MRQSPKRALTRLIALIAVLVVGWILLQPPPPGVRTGPAAYVAAGSTLWVFPVDQQTVPGVLEVEGPIDALGYAQEGQRLVATTPTGLRVFDTIANRPLPALPTERAPSGLWYDEEQELVYVLHPSRNLVTVLDFSQAAGGRCLSLLMTGPPPHYLAGDPRRPGLFLGNGGRQVSRFDPRSGKLLASRNLDEVGAMTCDGACLYLAQVGSGRLLKLHADTLGTAGSLELLKGEEPGQLLVDPARGGLWIIGQQSARAVDLKTWESGEPIALPGPPGQAGFVERDGTRDLWIPVPSRRLLLVLDARRQRTRLRLPVRGEPTAVVGVPASR